MSQPFLDLISSDLLALTAAFSFLIYISRRQHLSDAGEAVRPARLWLLATVGLIYLSADEHFDLHSSYDDWIHQALGMQETNITDRIDDLIIGLYLIVAIRIMWRYRDEVFNASVTRGPVGLLAVGFAFGILHVVCDVLSNRNDVYRILFSQKLAGAVHRWTSHCEQFFELGAESLFVVAFGWILVRSCVRKTPVPASGARR